MTNEANTLEAKIMLLFTKTDYLIKPVQAKIFYKKIFRLRECKTGYRKDNLRWKHTLSSNLAIVIPGILKTGLKLELRLCDCFRASGDQCSSSCVQIHMCKQNYVLFILKNKYCDIRTLTQTFVSKNRVGLDRRQKCSYEAKVEETLACFRRRFSL